ncbi:MAG: hypothetical protein JRN06_13220 [Nitrososphaerota archaeon]|nr:hypothetical protein [Nitrososphaerota archaeon]
MSDQGLVIAKRSVSLTKSYPVMGVVLTFIGVLFSSVSSLVGVSPTAGASLVRGGSPSLGVPFLAVPFQALSAIIFSTPVLLLFVYDKNNGVLEYLLSLGMDQGDIYRQYLKAALMLASAIVTFDVVVDLAVGAIEGEAGYAVAISALVVAFALPAVSLGALLMMSFSSLQKQRMGSNQPLGMAIGTFVVMPTYLLPIVEPAAAFSVDLVLAGLVVMFSLVTFLLSSHWISREKLLP